MKPHPTAPCQGMAIYIQGGAHTLYPMGKDPLERGYASMRDFVSGDGSVSTVFSGLKGLDRATVDRIFQSHRRELEELDPARSVILESMVAFDTRRPRT